MARYRRYRRTIIRAPKKRWCSNMIDINIQNMDTTGVGALANVTALAENKSETTSPTPVIIKTGNFKLQGDMHMSGGTGVSTIATLYIIFVPQGISVTGVSALSSLVQNHPEWILAWRVLESGTVGATEQPFESNRFTVSSRLKRNLNSGDGIYAVLIVDNTVAGVSVNIRGKCQFWTCAN